MARAQNPPPPAAGEFHSSELRRDVSVWGSYMWGYADVGADIYTALGIVALAAAGLTPLAFLLAGSVYALVGLCYAELASAYPVAGGGQYFTLRGIGDAFGFLAGSALLLDYIIDISLFTVVAFGYLNYFLPLAQSLQQVHVGPLTIQWLWLLETLAGIGILVWLNYLGIRISSLVNEVLGVVTIAAQSIIVVAGFVLVWNPDLLVRQFVAGLHFATPTLGQFAFGTSLAIISFVGLESISQVAQETRRPATIIPRTSIGLVLSVLLFAIAFSVLTVGMLDTNAFKGHEGDPVRLLAQNIPIIGVVAAPLTALVGGIVVYISANSGVVSVSRLTYSMSQFQLLPAWFNKVNARYRTPARTIVVFSGAAMVITLFAFLIPGKATGSNAAIDVLADLYAFGATFGYLLVFTSLMVLRFRDPYTPRPYRMPINIQIRFRGTPIWFPVLGVVGFLGVLFFLVMVIATHAYARIAGPLWVLLAFVGYALYRRHQKLPVLRTVPRNWESVTKQVLESAEEWQSLEEYEAALAERDRAKPSS